MILDCPSCETRFLVNSSLIPAEGRPVRCAKCGHTWHVMPDGDNADTPQEDTTVDAMPNLQEVEAESFEEVSIDMGSAVPAVAEKKPSLSAMPMVLLSIVLLVACAVAALFTFRNALEPSMPGIYVMLGMESSEGVVLSDVEYRERPSKTKKRYVVEGKILNQSDQVRKIPLLRVAIADKDGNWITSREYEADEYLQPGQSYPFKASNIDTAFVDRIDHLVVELGNSVQLMLRE